LGRRGRRPCRKELGFGKGEKNTPKTHTNPKKNWQEPDNWTKKKTSQQPWVGRTETEGSKRKEMIEGELLEKLSEPTKGNK